MNSGKNFGVLPMFPLPGVVLMPGAVLPLHIFEPRYRTMVAHCMLTDQMMALATLFPGYEDDYHGNPEVYPVMGLGRIVSHQQFSDGRSNILLQSVGRVRRVGEQAAEGGFRLAQVTPLECALDGLEHGMTAVRSLVYRIGSVNADASTESKRLLDLDDASLVDVLARKVITRTEERLQYMAHEHIRGRIDQVQEALAELVLQECATAGAC